MDGNFWVDTRPPFITATAPTVTLSGTMQILLPTGDLPMLPSNYFGYIGKAVRLKMHGMVSTGTTPGNLTISLFWNANASNTGTTIASTGATAMIASATNVRFVLEAIIRCTALGASGALRATGFQINAATLSATAAVTIPGTGSTGTGTTCDLTQAGYTISPQAYRSGSTAETLTIEEFLFESLN